jgi:uncharacterized membrane protein HdeD (DUF308 family)
MTTAPVLHDQELLGRWGWLLAVGVITVILGITALFMIPIATVAAVLVLGGLMVSSGIVEAIHAFRVHGWRGVSLHMIAGIVGILIGLVIVTYRVAGPLALALLFASFFTITGALRIITAARLRFRQWGWIVFDGALSLLAGLILAIEWPWSGSWFMALALGISMIIRGWSYVMLSLAVRSLPEAVEIQRAA